MTADELARSYLEKARKRKRVLEVLLDEEEAYSDVVREAQELVEPGLKAMLRSLGIDPPKWHDVGPIPLEQQALFPEPLRAELPQLAAISKWLRKEREFAFYLLLRHRLHSHRRLQARGRGAGAERRAVRLVPCRGAHCAWTLIPIPPSSRRLSALGVATRRSFPSPEILFT
jgi:HEPN domain-containing protein